MLTEKYITLTKYQFSLDGENFAEGFIFSDTDIPVPEGTMLEAAIDGRNIDGKLMFHKNRFLLSIRQDAHPDIADFEKSQEAVKNL